MEHRFFMLGVAGTRFAVVFAMFSWLGAASAIQPAEAGLQPLLDRQQAIFAEQQLLNQRLQRATTLPAERAMAYRTYMTMELERRKLACEVERARSWAASPLVVFTASAEARACRGE